jgi:LruC domain-containing protein
MKKFTMIYETNHFRKMLKPLTTLIVLIVLISSSLITNGANWYVAKTGINSAGHGTSVGDPFLTIGYAVTSASAGDVINVAAGTYSEYMSITKALTLNGANANIAGNGIRGAETKVQDLSGYTIFSVKSDGVTINGFEITAPSSNNAIYMGDGSGNYNYSNINIEFNYVHDVGTQRGSSNVYAIDYYVPVIAATTSNINISDNRIDNVGNSGGTYVLAGHCGGIYFANSTSTGTVNNATIMRNVITNIKSITSGKNTWGIVIGTGSTGGGKIVNPVISNNEISGLASLSGTSSHAIGLEGNTPGASVTFNKISLTSSQYGVYLSSNNGTGIKVNNNSITSVSKGIVNVTLNSVDGTCNWWGQTSSISGKVSGTVTYTPWSLNGTDGDLNATGFQPTAACLSPCNLVIAPASTPTCQSSSNGTVSVSITSGGSGTYTYLWKQGATTLGTTASISGLSAATYTIAVTDVNGCTASSSSIVGTSARPTANITGGTSSSVTVALTGATPWSGTLSDGTTFTSTTTPKTITLSPTGTTTYTVATLTDANSCPTIAGDLTGSYTITMKAATPLISLPTGIYINQQSITITTSTSNATIKYTTDGSIPSQSNGILYSGAVIINTSSTLKAIAYKTAYTNSDISTANYTILIDTDGDGVIDSEDAYPNDSTRAFNNYFPAENKGSLAFEDSWPSKGDYDMNDVVVDYQFKNITNAHNQLVETFASFTLKASGASYNNGFGFQLATNDIPSSAIQVTGSSIKESFLMLNANGTEQGQDKSTLIVFDNAYDVLQYPGSGLGFNTSPDAPYVTPVTITLHIIYTPYTYTEQQLDIAHFNPFIIVNKVRGKEVHLPDYTPTALVNPTYFGTGDDKSNLAQGKYYKTANNLPWALNMYNGFNYPNEKAEITKAYLHFIDWVLSNGTSYTDWYTNTAAGYRNNTNIYSKDKK